MAWLYLILAGLMEVGWPVGFNLAWRDGDFQWKPAALAVFSMVASFGLMLLTMAQKTIPVGTIYAVWTGIGSAGAVFVGIWLFKEPATAVRLVCVLLIVAGVVGLKLAESH
jgi:quaternary ammonium compound-resistance protein SugE